LVSAYPDLNRSQNLGSPEAEAARQTCVLVVEDDESVSKYLKERLKSDGYGVECVADGVTAEHRIASSACDLVILDLNLPHLDGAELLKRVRARDRFLPVLVLTGRAHLEDRIKTLDLGADDYLLKPFEYGELMARVRALLRRARPEDLIWRFADLELNRMERTVKRAGRPIELTAKEFALLEYLMLNSGQRLTRAMIMEHVWKLGFNAATNVVDVYINYLRNKVDRGFEPKLIRTVRGVGYQLGSEAAGRGGPSPAN
jgi:two-component system copper resistance phosphate regulon response regulator CusR